MVCLAQNPQVSRRHIVNITVVVVVKLQPFSHSANLALPANLLRLGFLQRLPVIRLQVNLRIPLFLAKARGFDFLFVAWCLTHLLSMGCEFALGIARPFSGESYVGYFQLGD